MWMRGPRRSISEDGAPAELNVEVRGTGSMTAELNEQILTLCNAAYGEDLTELYATFGPATHVLGRKAGALVSHAMWVTRWLEPGGHRPLKTAYVEFVATHPTEQRNGHATTVLRRLMAEIPSDYRLAALCPATRGLYARLGWRYWRGPLSIRCPNGPDVATPDERVMVYTLGASPQLDFDAALSAEWREGELW